MDLNVIFYILSFLLFVIIILQIVIFVNLKNNNQKNLNLADNIKNLETTIIKEENENYVKVIKQLESSQINLINTLNKSLENLRDMNDKKLNEIRHSNEEKLNQIDKNINDRLEISLNDKIDKSFSNIGEQLAKLYKTTGELQNLSVGVTNLQKTLSNVKTRGVFGERQLESILSNMLTSNQYEIQYKLNNEENRIVDFAIKIPEKNGENFIYLPIDSKFPSDYYTKVVRASETGNEELVKSAVKELRTEILNQAKSISEKYIIPPITTDFALMFLPTEGLYSECLRIDNLAEDCYKYKILFVGPTTISAIINSLSIGFRYLKVNEKSVEINKMLQAIRSQYDKFGEEVEKAKDNIRKAQDSVEKIDKRRNLIDKNLKSIDRIDIKSSNDLLGIDYENYS